MAKKKTDILPLAVLPTSPALTEAAARVYEFITQFDPTDPAFGPTLAGMDDGIRDLWEHMRRCEAAVESIKAALKAALLANMANLPKCCSFEAQTYQCKFTDSVSAAMQLAEKCGIDVAKFTCSLTPTQAMKVAGIGEAELVEKVGDLFVKTPKERTLNVK